MPGLIAEPGDLREGVAERVLVDVEELLGPIPYANLHLGDRAGSRRWPDAVGRWDALGHRRPELHAGERVGFVLGQQRAGVRQGGHRLERSLRSRCRFGHRCLSGRWRLRWRSRCRAGARAGRQGEARDEADRQRRRAPSEGCAVAHGA